MAPMAAAAAARRRWSGGGALQGRRAHPLRRHGAETIVETGAWRRWRGVGRSGVQGRRAVRRGERAGAPTGAVGVAWPSWRGSGAGERGDAAGSAVDRRRRRGLSWERRGGESSVGAARRVAAGQGGAGSVPGGSRKALRPSWPAAIDAAGTWAWRDARRVRSRAAARRWAPKRVGCARRPSAARGGSRAHHRVMGSRVNLRFSAGRPRVCRDPGRAKRPESAVPWS